MEIYNYEPNLKRAVLDNLWVLAVAVIGFPLTAYFISGERDPTILAWWAIGGGVLYFAFRLGMELWDGLTTVKVLDEMVVVQNRRGTRSARWDAVFAFTHTRVGERASWSFLAEDGSELAGFDLDGSGTQRWETMNESMLSLLTAHGVTEDPGAGAPRGVTRRCRPTWDPTVLVSQAVHSRL